MDLNTVTEFVADPQPADWRPGDAWLAGGTWLFSEPQEGVHRLLDLTSLDWPAIEYESGDLRIAATCTVAELYRFEPPAGSTIGPLIRQCCHAFLASFKIWNLATIGGNLGNALPAGPMISLTAALDGRCELWSASEIRHLDVRELITGDNQNALAPGELIRSITLPARVLASRTAFRQQSLNPHGRSAALLIGRHDPDGEFVLTVTASTVRPVQLRFDRLPDADELRLTIDARIGLELYHNDVHGRPAWRRHLTYRLAEEIRRELS
jgi:CO/xanthine dehydrogenase FAD-binding subunit